MSTLQIKTTYHPIQTNYQLTKNKFKKFNESNQFGNLPHHFQMWSCAMMTYLYFIIMYKITARHAAIIAQAAYRSQNVARVNQVSYSGMVFAVTLILPPQLKVLLLLLNSRQNLCLQILCNQLMGCKLQESKYITMIPNFKILRIIIQTLQLNFINILIFYWIIVSRSLYELKRMTKARVLVQIRRRYKFHKE